jgi:hypothetical protein
MAGFRGSAALGGLVDKLGDTDDVPITAREAYWPFRERGQHAFAVAPAPRRVNAPVVEQGVGVRVPKK